MDLGCPDNARSENNYKIGVWGVGSTKNRISLGAAPWPCADNFSNRLVLKMWVNNLNVWKVLMILQEKNRVKMKYTK